VYAILEFPGGPALSVGYRRRATAETALERLRSADPRYSRHVVVALEPPVVPAVHEPCEA
jgi:hypothetical protein